MSEVNKYYKKKLEYRDWKLEGISVGLIEKVTFKQNLKKGINLEITGGIPFLAEGTRQFKGPKLCSRKKKETNMAGAA